MLSLDSYLKSGQTIISNLLIKNYRRLGLNNDEFILWIQLYKYHEKGNDFPDLATIADNMQIDQDEVYQLMDQLVQKKVLTIRSIKDKDGIMNDAYDFSLIFKKLELLTEQQKTQDLQQTLEEKVQTLYQMFEREFGRALSPIEYQRIGQWLDDDHYAPELIQLALKEAVLNQVYSLNYIDRILLSWEKKNIKTKHQVEAEQQKRKRRMLQNEPSRDEKELPNVSMHNWLEE
ncbi:MAG TPA: DnaD domain protein [Tetragenococcus sp.]|nr:DnaD domain protein [Tetragenococcus sp.]